MSSEYIPVELKQIVFARAFGMCEYCHRQAKYAVDPFVIDHIQLVSRNGKTTAENLALSYPPLMSVKATKTS